MTRTDRLDARGVRRYALQTAAAVLTAMLTIDALGPAPALGAPQKPQVVNGTAVITAQGNQTTIRASNGAIINYAAFNIGPQETVRFIQPNAAARVLNRITGPDPTTIAGAISANGIVYFVNPHGIYFANTARIDVAAIYAAAGNLANADFLRGADHFTALSGTVTNQGLINANSVALIGGHVLNTGTINAAGGLIALVAGKDVYLTYMGDHCLVQADASNLSDPPLAATPAVPAPGVAAIPGVENTGVLSAPRGQVFLGAGDTYSLAIRNRGRISVPGGNVAIAAHDGEVLNQGEIHADGQDGKAGSVVVQAPAIVQDGTITADAASGPAGTISVVSHDSTQLGATSRLSAAGGATSGDGGHILVNSLAGTTDVAAGAALDVSGGSGGGNGGFLEISGYQLNFAGYADVLGHAGGVDGTLLFDPTHNYTADTTINQAFLDALVSGLPGSVILQLNITTNAPGADTFTIDSFTFNGGLIIKAPKIAFDFTSSNPAQTTKIQEYNGPVTLKTDATLAATYVFFDSTVVSDASGPQRSLKVQGPNGATGGAVTFSANVGGTETTTKNTALPTALSTLDIQGPVNFGSDPPAKLAAQGKPVNEPLQVWTIGTQRYQGDVQLNLDTVLTTLGTPIPTVTFDAYIHSDPHAGPIGSNRAADLTVDGNVKFNAPVSEYLNGVYPDLVNSITVNGTTEINIDAAVFLNGSLPYGHQIATYGSQTYYGPVQLDKTADVFSQTGNVRFLSTLDSPGDGGAGLTIEARQGHVQFGDKVGSSGALSYLSAYAGIDLGKTITINADGTLASPSILVRGDITFNDAATGVPAVATITAINDANPATPCNLVIQSLNGNFTMGQGNKLTVANGALTILAPNGTASLGDLNAFTDITVTAGAIQFLKRNASTLKDSNWGDVTDLGLDVVANGTFTLNGPTSAIGSGGAVRFGSPLANPDLSTPALAGQGFEVIQTSAALGLNRFIYQGSADAGLDSDPVLHGTRVLDETLTIAPPPNPNPTPGVLPDLGRFVPTGPIPFEDHMVREALLGPPSRQGLAAAFNLAPRDPSAGEYATFLQLTYLFDDLVSQPKDVAAQDQLVLVLNRIRRDSALETLERYRELFLAGPASGGAAAGDIASPGSGANSGGGAAEMKRAFADAWQAYGKTAGAKPTAAGFHAYLAALPKDSALTRDVSGLNAIFDTARLVGLTDLEFAALVRAVLVPIAPDGLPAPGLYTAVAGKPLPPTVPAVTALAPR